MARLRLLLFSFLCVMQICLNTAQAQSNPSSTENSQNEDDRGLFTPYNITNVKIITDDNLKLDARLYDPKLSSFSGRRPALIFTNSWALNEYEYEFHARKFAAKGYIVLAYSSRGFGGSEGTVTVAGPNDVRDFSTVIDWLEVNTRVDNERIGMAGVSYGGGLALLAAGLEPRIAVVASMSGWGNLAESLYRNETIQRTWLGILIGSGKLTGKLDPDIFAQIKAMADRTDPEATRAWAAARSPESYVDEINRRGVPVFLENSYLDALFPPLQIKGFYEKIQSPKRMMADEGIHASAAIPGLFGLPSPVWSEVHNWFDHFLVDSRINIRTGLSFQNGLFTDYYQDYPKRNSSPIALNALNKRSSIDGRSVVSIRGNIDSGAKSGIPIIADTIDSYTGIEVKQNISRVDQRYGFVFQSERLSRAFKVQGATRVNFTLMPHETPVTLVAYLYDENIWGTGSLVSYSVMSFQDPSMATKDIAFDLNVTSYNVKAGNRLTLVLDTVDSLYTPATTMPFMASIAVDSDVSLELPTVP